MSAMPDLTVDHPVLARLTALRAAMAERGWQAVLIPSSDPHLSEYLPGHWQGREWFSGFTGSSGTLVVAAQSAALFTDSRYWEQAESELSGTGIDLVKLEGPAVPAYVRWLRTQATAGVLAVDGDVLALAQTQPLQQALTEGGWTLATGEDPLAGV
ncbi:MAG: aminopeptidase P family N-terminal domain-containing protein, partial [Burkholderiales bacterium]|nr:aminopeptidase P family N-terminal domain-containing protein [Burkholderiales bacterium]